MFVAGIDGCRGGWIAFKVELPSLATSFELIELPAILRNKPPDLAYLAIDIPIGLLDGSRACDKAARKLLARSRASPSALSSNAFRPLPSAGRPSKTNDSQPQ
jgi:predicted RNase H-like nuclease